MAIYVAKKKKKNWEEKQKKKKKTIRRKIMLLGLYSIAFDGTQSATPIEHTQNVAKEFDYVQSFMYTYIK